MQGPHSSHGHELFRSGRLKENPQRMVLRQCDFCTRKKQNESSGTCRYSLSATNEGEQQLTHVKTLHSGKEKRRCRRLQPIRKCISHPV